MFFGDLIEKGREGDILLLKFPHPEAPERSERKETYGRELGPNCLFRFLPMIAELSDGSVANNRISNMGDVLRPKQFVKHKYQAYKSAYSYEDLLRVLHKTLEDNVNKNQELIFIGSTVESFPTLYGFFKNKKKQRVLIFSPYLNLENHYNDHNIRKESSIRYLLESLKIEEEIDLHIIGVDKRLVKGEEKDQLDKYSDRLNIHYMDELTQEKVLSLLDTKNDTEMLISFSFDVISSEFFPGKNYNTWNPVFDNFFCLKLFRKFAKVKGTRLLSFFDFNPQIEDYTSGVFYATLIYEYLMIKAKIEQNCFK